MSCWTAETEKIIKAHQADFNSSNWQAKLASYGGYSAYLNKLGGVFAKWNGKNGSVKTAAQFQEIAQYVFGLMAVYGFNYNNGRFTVRWGGGSPFYPSADDGRCNWGEIDTLCSSAEKSKTTNCNFGMDSLYYKAGIMPGRIKLSDMYKAQARKYKVIRKKSDLRIGDLVHMFGERVTSDDPDTWEDWHHVCCVGEKYGDKVIMYDTGSRFISSGNFKHELTVNGNNEPTGDYSSYDGWVGIRIVELAGNGGTEMTGEWKQGSKGWWYQYADGSYATGWELLPWSGGTNWFYFDSDGWMLTGWRRLKWSGGESWFFFDYKTGAMKVGWHKLPWGDGKEDWFLLDPKTGAMLTGWQWSTKDGKAGWYFLDKSTGAMHVGWVYDNGSWFYLGADGKMVTGWVIYKGRKCYLEPKSDKTHVQGVCYVNRTAVIDGKTYRFDKDGYAEELTSTGNITKVSGKLNDISASRRQFVIDIANYVRKYAPQYGIKVYSPVIAQAIHESGWGESKLAAKYHNYFGLKCGTAWKGKSVNMKTQEEYSAGTMTTISANFRVYDSMDQGVKGYFEFIQLPRYSNLKGVTSPRKYLENIIADGYATGKSYVDHVMNLVNLYNLTQFDAPVLQPAAKPTEDPIDYAISLAESYVGYHEGANNKTIFGDTMHAIQPSNMDANAPWCDAFVDFVILKTCEHFGKGAETARMVLGGDFDDYTYNSVALYKKAGRWANTPSRGDQIFFGGSGHTGIVTSVENGTVHTIEGNKADEVRRGSYSTSSPSIIGYGRPRYDLITGKITAADMPLVKKGSKGEAVRKLQEMLNAKGYKLTEDGDFGSKTEAAVKAYQKANGLEVDGEVGEKTWGSLFK